MKIVLPSRRNADFSGRDVPFCFLLACLLARPGVPAGPCLRPFPFCFANAPPKVLRGDPQGPQGLPEGPPRRPQRPPGHPQRPPTAPLGPQGTPRLAQRLPKAPPRASQGAPKGPQGLPKGPPKRPKGPQGVPQGPPSRSQSSMALYGLNWLIHSGAAFWLTIFDRISWCFTKALPSRPKPSKGAHGFLYQWAWMGSTG